ncbi:MAG: hypothetical protein ACOX3U_00845 [Christensenellales bacterium]|jgi:hypothetical protein
MQKSEYGEAVIKWITVTVLIAISLFFFFLYRNVFLITPKGQTEEQPDPTNTPGSTPGDEEEEDEEPPAQTIVYSILPRSAVTGEGGEYHINTGGPMSDKLKDVIDIGGYYYLILETASNGGDYRAETESVAVAKLDYSGTLLSTVTLINTRNEKYLCSKINNNGILIAAKGAGGITYYDVNFDLEYSKAVTSDDFTQLKMYYTRDFVLCAGIKGKNMTVFAYDEALNRLFSNVIAYEGEAGVLEIFPSVSGFSIIVNQQSETPCSYLTAINGSGGLINKRLLTNSRLLKIYPTPEGGFTLLELSGKTLYLKCVSNSMSELFRTAIGEGNGGDFYPLHNGYITFIYSEYPTISKHLCRFGDIITVNERDFEDIASIKSFCYTQDAIYFYADAVSHGGTKDTRIINYNSNNAVTYSEVIGGYYQDNAVKLYIKNNLAIAFMYSHSVNAAFMNNFGGSDVFVFCRSTA